MNTNHYIIRNLTVMTLAGLAAGLVVSPVRAADCSNPAGFVERRACAKAAEGIDALRRFADRTRMIHGLYLPDYDKAFAPQAAAGPAEKDQVARTDPHSLTSGESDKRTAR